jgi:hypothetical protein
VWPRLRVSADRTHNRSLTLQLYYAKWEANPLLPNFLEVIGRPPEDCLALKEEADADAVDSSPSIKDAFKHKVCTLHARGVRGTLHCIPNAAVRAFVRSCDC